MLLVLYSPVHLLFRGRCDAILKRIVEGLNLDGQVPASAFAAGAWMTSVIIRMASISLPSLILIDARSPMLNSVSG
jgi:hypothetical protein